MVLSYSNPVRLDPFVQNQSLEDGELDVKFTLHAESRVSKFLFHLCGILSGGILYLVCYWMPRIYANLFTNVILNSLILDSTSSSSSNILSPPQFSGNYLYVCDLHKLKSRYTLYVLCQNTWNENVLINFIDLPFNVFVANALPYSATHSFFLKSIQKYHFNLSSVLYFEYRSCRYIFDPLDLKLVSLTNYKDWNWINDNSCFCQELSDQLSTTSISQILEHGLPSSFAHEKSLILGLNDININPPSIPQLMIHEILHPFYIFQLFSIAVWLAENYYFYAVCIFFISLISSVQNLFDTRRNYARLEELSKFTCQIKVFRNDKWSIIQSHDLVPGDIYKVPLPYSSLVTDSNAVPPCDSILLLGDCIVNESALTGESIPTSKHGILGKNGDLTQELELFLNSVKIDAPTMESKHLQNVLFSGTKIIQGTPSSVNNDIIAMVLRIGFQTTKGSLVRSMLHPRQLKFKFYQDSFKFIGIMALVALIGFIYTTYNFVIMGESWYIICLRGLDLVTITVPPALLSAMSVGIGFALHRLRKEDIYCISPNRINVAGLINLLLFDKTGTLTVDGLVLLGAQECITSKNKLIFDSAVAECRSELQRHGKMNRMLICMATCHDIKLVNSHLLGDPLELEMFKFTNGVFKNGLITLQGEEIEIIKIFEFDAALRQMSVIIRIKAKYYLTVKGAPEVFQQSCEMLPLDFNEILSECSHNGFRVLACGIKELKSAELSFTRVELEKDIDFIGFLIFENKLKLGTTRVIETLNAARIHMGMCTGDNMLTAISVGRECGLLPPSPRLISNLRKSSLAMHNIVYDNLFPQEAGYVNMDDEMIPSGSFSMRNNSLLENRQNSGFSSSSSDTEYPETQLESPGSLVLGGSESNFLLFIPCYNNHNLEWRSLDVPILRLKDMSIEINMDISHLKVQFSPRFMSNLQKQESFLRENLSVLENIQICFAMDGDCYNYLVQNKPFNELEYYLTKCRIFARMSPDQKADLVERLQKVDYVVGFVGDGANDCGALKASDVGLSLSEAEASIAAPFTSKNFEIECVVTLMREGRAALTTSFSCFKYMAMYSLIQFITVTMLYNVGSNLGDLQFLYVDLLLILPLAITMAYNGPCEYLHSKKPTANLFSVKVLGSLLGQVVVQFAFQLCLYIIIKSTSFYTRPQTNPETEDIRCFENTVLFINSSFQYIILACVYSIGPPYRAPLSKNTVFIIVVMILTFITTILSMGIFKWSTRVMELMDMPFWFRSMLIAYSLLNFVASWIGEKYIFRGLLKSWN